MAQELVKDVEHASFSPLVLSASGSLPKEATIFYKDWQLSLLTNVISPMV